ncbi:hypothetical protein HHK36_022575 [Tetracentron sinense]|uniref:SWI/SNF-related matrix-associated actin-dependent regulator of chromatin subfamily A member 3-like 3 n=1 Tax=Tetracentron sinense TaxID=13715 RepID=A0A835D6F9_TETSI|nr:hypothetical protein HHK36_022575 [Tetracentron sinense]
MATMATGEDEKMAKIRSAIGSYLPESDILQTLLISGNNPDAAINVILDTPGFLSGSVTVKRTGTSTGARISTQIKQETLEGSDGYDSVKGLKAKVRVKGEESEMGFENKVSVMEEVVGLDSVLPLVPKNEILELSSDDKPNMGFVKKDFLNEEMVGLDRILPLVPQNESMDLSSDDKPNMGFEKKVSVKEEMVDSEQLQALVPRNESMDLSSDDKPHMGFEKKVSVKEEIVGSDQLLALVLRKEILDLSSDDKPDMGLEKKVSVKEEMVGSDQLLALVPRKEILDLSSDDKPDSGFEKKVSVKEEVAGLDQHRSLVPKKEILDLSSDENFRLRNRLALVCHNPPKPSHGKQEIIEVQKPGSLMVEDGEFPEEPDWLLVGRTTVTGLSTCKGRKLEFNEIVHFAFPPADSRRKYNTQQWVSTKTAAAASEIVRFSTKRYGEIGRLPMEWARCLTPLVNSTKVKIHGRCVAAPSYLSLMQEIVLYVSFYIHSSIFTAGDNKSSWKLVAPSHVDSTVHPLPTLFKLLKINPFQKAEFTPEELDTRKRSLNLEGDSNDVSVLPIMKRRKGSENYHPEQSKDEQVISESSLNKLVGSADVYNLEEMEPPSTLMCDLWPYQKQALHWMSESEKGIDVEQATKTLHPCWAAYRICDKRAAIYVNIFSGEATTQFPSATQMARGGILADAMGLGKTVMTIALILATPGRGIPDNQEAVTEVVDDPEKRRNTKKDSLTKVQPTVKGGTLIVCPMALLGQWKDELETHSKPKSISVFVHYGGDRTSDPKVISEHDVVLTTYGVLTSAYKYDSEKSIFHQVQWYRVVLDEAHIIKSSKTQGAQAAFTLSSHCRWCLTGTPLQLTILIGWLTTWKIFTAFYASCMLSHGATGHVRPILVLPPVDIQIIECEQSEAEYDFYDALFKRSKVQFDQFVAQGKVLHNYASILELLLRLRQCCNHPFLVMSRGDSEKYADLNKLARRFLETNSDPAYPSQTLPTRAYVEEVVEGIRRGENTECPICLESADDPVLTPCAHLMCRECILSSWRTSSSGMCPICRKLLRKADLITCPSSNRFRIDIKNWKDSSKITMLMDCLERIHCSGSGEKSIVFSQWTSFLDLLQIPLNNRGIGFLRFDGKLSQKHRERVLKEFNDTDENLVLLMSLKAGGVGLNLTAACNVFLMDPWWNPAVEEQAIMRIHRIGQKQTVCVRRFIVKDTVEEKMQLVQARKQRMIAGALTDEEVRTARIEELKMLFR